MLICDFAETYHVLDYKELPPATAAALLVGLGEDSRVKKYLSGNKISLKEALLAVIADRLNFIAWTKTEDAHRGRRYKGKSIYEALTKKPEPKEELMVFDTVEDYEEYMKRFR